MENYKPRTEKRREMWNKAGFRERYAMQHGNARKVTDGWHVLIVFTYSPRDEYQDANGAKWDTGRREWVE